LLPLRLRDAEAGPVLLRVVLEGADGEYTLAGEFAVEGVRMPAPRLQLGALALGLRPGEEGILALGNRGTAPLENLRYELAGPFVLAAAPERLAAGATAQLRLALAEGAMGEGLLQVHSNDPDQPLALVALRGLAGTGPAWTLAAQAVDPEGRFAVPASSEDRLLILYATEGGEEDSAAVFPFALGGSLAKLAAVAPPLADARDAGEAMLRQQERDLALGLQGQVLPAAKPALGEAQIGQVRRFVFPEFGVVRQQEVQARLVAISARALGWIHEGAGVPGEAQVAEIVRQFSDEDFPLVGERFGLPADVDGDGRVSFLFSPLVDQIGGLAGFYSAVSSLPVALGGTGDQADLMFLSPSQPADTYRSLLVHEFQHLVNFNQHVLVRGGAGESNWLNEGLSHLAEDLVAGYAESGQGQILTAFLADPSAVGLAGEALMDRRKRGAAYLFVRSLADRLGDGVVLRLVNTGLSDRDNVEQATGEGFGALLGGWGAQLYLSGLGVFPHNRFEYQNALLRAGEGRGFPLPVTGTYRTGGAALQGSLRPRGLALVNLPAGGAVAGRLAPEARGQVLLLPLPENFQPQLSVPADQVPGVHFTRLLPGRYLTDREYLIEGQLLAAEHTQVLIRFAGADTLRFYPRVEAGEFSQVLSFKAAQAGVYHLEIFLGTGEGLLDAAGGFGPVEVVLQPAQTAVEEEKVLPGALVLGEAFPNPFNPLTLLPLELPGEGGVVEVGVYNLLGQRVRLLAGGSLPAGRQLLAWDGRNDHGGPVASGVYLFRVAWKGKVMVRRVLLLR
ncbi:MAG: hypothetical protein IT369_04560, partial [Candidatus Latescibacteria bacterium]|nr:hypothetical protein [Candidatus Latescibacterota bacterium]